MTTTPTFEAWAGAKGLPLTRAPFPATYKDATTETAWQAWVNSARRRADVPRETCGAYQASDQMTCACGLGWDMNDPYPPTCPTTTTKENSNA